VTDAIRNADEDFGYSIRLTRLVDGEATYTLRLPGAEPMEFESNEDANEYVSAERNKRRADAVLLAFAQQPEGWRPIQTAPADEPFIAGLWVTNNQTGARWWEWYVVAIDDETGEARGYPDGEPLPWSLADFEAWHPVPAPPAAMLDVAPIPGEE